MRPLIVILISVATFALVVDGVLCVCSEQRELENAALKAHNKYRARHGVPPLTISRKLSKYATEWAETLAEEEMFAHRPDGLYGENIYMSSGSRPTSAADAGSAAVKAWYDEEPLFKYDREPKDLSAGHFTQVVWKDSKKIGLGLGRGAGNRVVVVANYSPRGNIRGSFGSQVPRPRK